MLDKENVILVGENTSGTLISGNAVIYELPNSKLKIKLASESYKNTVLLKCLEQWKGENCGFFPDYWITDNNLKQTIEYITKDNHISQLLK